LKVLVVDDNAHMRKLLITILQAFGVVHIFEADSGERGCTPLIPVDEAGLGGAMVALSQAQRAFVVAKVALGLSNIDAAQTAGYSARSPHALGVMASRIAHNDRVQTAIHEEGQRLMCSDGPEHSKARGPSHHRAGFASGPVIRRPMSHVRQGDSGHQSPRTDMRRFSLARRSDRPHAVEVTADRE